MGQTLSEPETTKHTTYGEDDRLVFAVSEMQGWRLSMEDAHATILDLDNQDESAEAQCGKGKKGKHSFFAVYDGHGGSTVAKYSGETVHQRLRALKEYKDQKYQASLKRAFLKTDEDLRSNPDYAHDTSGCTAVAALILEDNTILVANAGDSRSVLSIAGEAKPMSYDHKPVNKSENSRIVAAGGFVEFGRVNGNLALSRALGDFEFKQNNNLQAEQQIVTADPDIIQHTATPDDEFLVIACDGIWDVLKSQEVIDFVRRCLGNKKTLQEICELMLDKCVAPDSDWGGVGCDNMTFMVVAILNGKTKEEWYSWMEERVNSGVGYQTPMDLPDPFANRAANRPGGLMAGGPLSGPAQLLSNAINNGTLRFSQQDDDEDMETDSDDQNYHKSPTSIDDSAMIEDTTEEEVSSPSTSRSTKPTVPAESPSREHVSIDSTAAPEKLGSLATSHISPPSAVMGVGSPKAGSHNLAGTKPNANAAEQEKDDEIPSAVVREEGLMDRSEGPLSG